MFNRNYYEALRGQLLIIKSVPLLLEKGTGNTNPVFGKSVSVVYSAEPLLWSMFSVLNLLSQKTWPQ